MMMKASKKNKNTNNRRKKNVGEVEKKERSIEIIASYKVNKETELLQFLYEKITKESKNNIKHLLSSHKVLVDGACITQFNFVLYKDDLVQISKNPVNSTTRLNRNKREDKIKLDIIYEDEELIAINKPSGLLSIESDNIKTTTAYRYVMDYVRVKNKLARIFVVHRIDKDTSGVLLFAKNENIKNVLQHKWSDIVTNREYIAICEGTFDKKSGTIKSYLHVNSNTLMYSNNSSKTGQFSITNYQVLKENGKYSLVDVKIQTGRKNQIRVHMGDLGHKVVGDEKYKSEANPIGRLGLHAYILEFNHPISKKKMKFVAKIPESFNALF